MLKKRSKTPFNQSINQSEGNRKILLTQTLNSLFCERVDNSLICLRFNRLTPLTTVLRHLCTTINALLKFLLQRHRTILFQSRYLPFHKTIIKSMNRGERRMNPVALTTIHFRKGIGRVWDSMQCLTGSVFTNVCLQDFVILKIILLLNKACLLITGPDFKSDR